MANSFREISIIGSGPAGLIAAETITSAGFDVTVYEHKPSIARKFLLAGLGGLNITHNEDLDILISRYGKSSGFLAPAIEEFSPQSLREWCAGLGEETFTGTSDRIFPKSFKATPLLRNWSARLSESGVTFKTRWRWTGWNDNGSLRFQTGQGIKEIHPQAVLLALGGASWPKMGSDGEWTNILKYKGITVSPWKPSNCGFIANLSEEFKNRFQGSPLKPVTLTFGGRSIKAEILITAKGVQGPGIYALSASLRDAIEKDGQATLMLDLRPDISEDLLAQKLAASRKGDSFTNIMRKIGLSHAAAALVREKKTVDKNGLAGLIKNFPLELTATTGLGRAISSAGGISLDELDSNYMLKKLPGVFAAGEMLDWEAPTGGYLLQACFSTGVKAARGLCDWLSG